MEIGGFIKQSLIDFPGKISSVIFTKACNFRCKYCHNPELVLPELIKNQPSISEVEILEYFEKYKHLLDAVSITGGEPCMQKDLISFIDNVKSLGLLIKLDTNGTFPEIINELINKKLIDYFAMDIKAPLVINKYKNIVGDNCISSSRIENIIKTQNAIIESGISYEFRTTVVKDLHSDVDIIEICKNVKGKLFLQLFTDNKTLDKHNNYSAYTENELLKILSIACIDQENIKIR